jgi:large subunit ribosomal protein L15
MKLNQLSDNPGARPGRKRLGRGIGSGLGKTSGKGHKGQKARTGVAVHAFEGGQMPLHRRLPKRGFAMPFRKEYRVINLGGLQKAIDAGRLPTAETINAEVLKAAGLIKSPRDGVRLLAKGTLAAKITIQVAGASKAAVEAVEKAGGSVIVAAATGAGAAA